MYTVCIIINLTQADTVGLDQNILSGRLDEKLGFPKNSYSHTITGELTFWVSPSLLLLLYVLYTV